MYSFAQTARSIDLHSGQGMSRVLHRLDMVGPGHQPKLSSLSPWSCPITSITGCKWLQYVTILSWTDMNCDDQSRCWQWLRYCSRAVQANTHWQGMEGFCTATFPFPIRHNGFCVFWQTFAVFLSADGCSSPGQEIPRWRAPKWSWPWKCDLATTGSRIDFLQVKKRA